MAAKASSELVGVVGFDDTFELAGRGIVVNYNDAVWNPSHGIDYGPPVVDFASSFDDEDRDGDGVIDPVGFPVKTGRNPVYIDHDGNQRIGASIEHAVLSLDEYIHVAGSISYEKGPTNIVDLDSDIPATPGLLEGFLAEFQEIVGDANLPLHFKRDGENLDLGTIEGLEVATTQIGASNVQMFVGTGGPYWSDLNLDGEESWLAPVLDGNGDVIEGQYVTLSAADAPLDVGGTFYGDVNGNGIIDADETLELSESATGLTISDVEFGLVLMDPTIFDLAKALEKVGGPIVEKARQALLTLGIGSDNQYVPKSLSFDLRQSEVSDDQYTQLRDDIQEEINRLEEKGIRVTSITATVDAGQFEEENVDLVNNQILFTTAHGLADGQLVVYDVNGNTPIGGLNDGDSYFIKRVDDKTIQILENPVGATVDLTSIGSGQQRLRPPIIDMDSENTVNIDVDTDRIIFSSAHNLTDGQAVEYDAAGNSSISGLTHGTTYFVK